MRLDAGVSEYDDDALGLGNQVAVRQSETGGPAGGPMFLLGEVPGGAGCYEPAATEDANDEVSQQAVLNSEAANSRTQVEVSISWLTQSS